ncbi:hypothetical protein, partial [Tepidimonas sp.]|uniref:hypothetical protein n=1 Tax=Tepidimonas sp. TaxID=2002775 RepID=UPI00391B081A
RIRAERAAYWPEIDKQRWDAEDANDNTAKAAAKTLRQKMKDAPTHASIVAAATPEALKAITLQTLLA